jgi:hypothetical protein
MLPGFFIVAIVFCVLGAALCRGQATFQAEADRLGELLNWRPGTVVAEIGAKNGKLALAAGECVGLSGKIYSKELDPEALAHLEEL